MTNNSVNVVNISIKKIQILSFGKFFIFILFLLVNFVQKHIVQSVELSKGHSLLNNKQINKLKGIFVKFAIVSLLYMHYWQTKINKLL